MHYALYISLGLFTINLLLIMLAVKVHQGSTDAEANPSRVPHPSILVGIEVLVFIPIILALYLATRGY